MIPNTSRGGARPVQDAGGCDGGPGLTADLIRQFGYLGIILLLVLGGLGLPVPEEAPIVLAAILSRRRTMWWPIALPACLAGVLLGDFVVYYLGYFYGEKVLSLRLTRKFLTKAREAQIKGYFHRHGVKILILGRFAVGFRTAAYLTAGILRLPALKLFLTDLCAASLSTLLMFGLGYWFADWIETGLRTAQHYLGVILAAAVMAGLLYRYVKARRQAGRHVGPPVLADDESPPLPPDDLHSPPKKPEPEPELAGGPPEALTLIVAPDPAIPIIAEADAGHLSAPHAGPTAPPAP